MAESPTIDRGIVAPIITSIEMLGGEVDALMQDSGLLASWSDTQSDVMPEAGVWELFERSSRSLDMPDVGLRVGSAWEVRDLGAFGRKLENSLTTLGCLGEYISTVNRYSSHSKFWLEINENGAWFCRQGIDIIDVGRGHVEQFTIQLMIRLVRLACGARWFPPSIRVQATTDQFYRNDLSYDSVDIDSGRSSTAIWIPSTALLEVVRWNDDAIIRCIRDCISIRKSGRRPTIDSAAQQLGFSVRTLQRELSSNGLDWTRLLDQVNLDRATRLLKTEMPLSDLSRELGYTDQANFGRTFRRWTGMTPKRYRGLFAKGD